MPTTIQLPRLYKLDPGQVLEVVRDLHCLLRGYRLIIAADAHELFDYCFPVNPKDKIRGVDVDSLAESQASLHYVFQYGEREAAPVVLLPEYRKEIQTLMDHIYQKTDAVYSAAQMIKEMIIAGNLEGSQEKEDLEFVVQNNFQFLLAVLMGIHSIGIDRMREANDRGLSTILDAVDPEDKNEFQRINAAYGKASTLADLVFNVLEAENVPGTQDERSARRANRNDADAIDRLIHLNVEADRSYRAGLLKHPYLFLYLSTTGKSRKVFNLPEIKAALPRIRDRRYSFWRNRHQVLAYVIYRSLSEVPTLHIKQTVDALKSLNTVLRKVRSFQKVLYREASECKECVLQGKVPVSCPFSNFCDEVKATSEKIKEKRDQVNNWGLLKQISSYSSLLDAGVPELGYRIYTELFQEIINSNLKDIALERMYLKQLWISRASDWTVLSDRLREGIDPSKERDFRTEKDQVTGIDQYLPCKPRFRSAEYSAIAALIIDFFRSPTSTELVEEAYRKFVKLEPETRQDDDEYDLLRCYLYLAGGEGEETHSYLEGVLTAKPGKNLSDASLRERLYVLCWSARRSGLYKEADQHASEGITRYPDDPRFFHGRALNTYAWLAQEKGEVLQIESAIGDSEKALILYQQDEHENQDVIAACYNNLAYFLALEVKTGTSYGPEERTTKLKSARQYLTNLKSTIDKDSMWKPLHPEFFHTEAFLEYQEVLHYWMGGDKDKEQLVKRLESAKQDIETAIGIYEGPKYKELESDLTDFYQKIMSGVVR